MIPQQCQNDNPVPSLRQKTQTRSVIKTVVLCKGLACWTVFSWIVFSLMLVIPIYVNSLRHYAGNSVTIGFLVPVVFSKVFHIRQCFFNCWYFFASFAVNVVILWNIFICVRFYILHEFTRNLANSKPVWNVLFQVETSISQKDLIKKGFSEYYTNIEIHENQIFSDALGGVISGIYFIAF